MIHYVIPARKDSKGIPFKNRRLFEYTAKTIPKKEYNNVIVSSDDEHILLTAKEYGFKTHIRSQDSASDESSTKDFMSEIINDMSLVGDICMLYLTYPQRTWKDVCEAYVFFNQLEAKSLLCKEPLQTHPYVCLYELDNSKGSQVISHDLCRRQDYPKCFKICHKIAILKHDEIKKLNSNLYNKDTVYFSIDKTLDVDEYSDLKGLTK
tara:strand:- start:79 stop:702 length:624 start_codon:yes stop_codon:yes gene_type:complete